MPNHDARAIANEFLKRAKRDGRELTNMQLQKLPYIAHGWDLALFDESLIHNNPKTWSYGPVYPDLYESLKKYGSDNVSDYIHEGDPVYGPIDRGDVLRAKLSGREKALLDRVWDNYGHLSAWKLSSITHQEDSPWSIIKEKEGYHADIPNPVIKKHYLDLIDAHKR